MQDDPWVYFNLYVNPFHFQPCSLFLSSRQPTKVHLGCSSDRHDGFVGWESDNEPCLSPQLHCLLPKSNVSQETRSSFLPRKCVREKIIHENSGLEMPFHVVLTMCHPQSRHVQGEPRRKGSFLLSFLQPLCAWSPPGCLQRRGPWAQHCGNEPLSWLCC